MKWHRVQPGYYEAGPYRVEEIAECWLATGPALVTDGDRRWDTKAYAQKAARLAAEARAADPDVEPVVGDVVMAHGTRRGTITSIMHGTREPLYCVGFVRNRKLCLLRREIEVIVP